LLPQLRPANLISKTVKAPTQQHFGCRIGAHAGKGKDLELKTMKALNSLSEISVGFRFLELLRSKKTIQES
jgi:hypothetical protein